MTRRTLYEWVMMARLTGALFALILTLPLLVRRSPMAVIAVLGSGLLWEAVMAHLATRLSPTSDDEANLRKARRKHQHEHQQEPQA